MTSNSLKLALRTSSAVLAMAATIYGAPALAQAADQTATPPATLGTSDSTAPARAAASTTAPAGDANANGEIVVTGSRLARAGYDAPTPVNVVGQERLQKLGIQNVADALNQIPSFRAITTPASNFFRVSGNIGGRSMDLRGLGPTRTLTLLDGKRFVAASDNQTVDTNSIPNILVRQVDVVTGGASAAYGANAVSGVVNFILDDKLNHLKADVSYGLSQRGDGAAFYAGLADGFDFAGGRGHVVFGGEYDNEKGIGPCETRDYCNKYTNYIANPGYNTTTRTSTNGLPATLVVDNQMFVYNENTILKGATIPNAAGTSTQLLQQVLNTPASGTMLPIALQGKQFTSSGDFQPYQFGAFLSGVFQVGRDPTQPYEIGLGQQPLVTPTEHYNGMAKVSYELTDTITATADFLYSRVIGGPVQGASPIDDGYNIGLDNPYLSTAARNAAIAALSPLITATNPSTATNRPKLSVNSGSIDLGPGNISTTKINTYRGSVGLKGKLFEGWDWDTYYTHGVTKARLDDKNSRLKLWNEGYDATRTGQAAIIAPNGVVMASATPSLAAFGIADGTIVCRTTLTNPTNGCIPFNFFGPNSVSAAAAAADIKPEWQTRTFKQDSAALNLRGSLFDTWAGPVKIAVGGEWRRDSAVGDVDPLTKAPLLAGAASNAGFISPQAVPLTSATRIDAASGATVADLSVPVRPIVTTVTEGYFEGSIPLLKDSAIGRSFDVDGAVRYSHYKPFGNATTWKVGGVYKPVDDIAVRVTKSKDVRAPSAGELNPLATVTLLPLPNPFIGATQNINVVTGGNAGLQLEKGDTFTAGVVLKPRFIPRFNMSLDFYNIKVKGAIDSLSGTAIMTACNTSNQLCNLITFAGTPKASSVTQILSTFQNLSRLHAEGFELVADYSVPAFGGTLAFQLNANYVEHLNTVSATGVLTQLDNWTGNNGSVTNIQGVPRYKIDGVISYSRPDWSVSLHPRYIPRALLDPTKIGPEDAGYDINNPNSQSTNRVDARFYLDLGFSVKLADTRNAGKIEMYGAINNVFDTTEPKQLRLIGNPLQFDPMLRYFKIGMRASF